MSRGVDRFGIGWSNKPEERDVGVKYRLIRLGTLPTLGGIILSGEIAGCNTHWSGSQTQPCAGGQCRFCAKNFRRDWHGYAFVRSIKTREVSIVEFRPGAAAKLSEQFSDSRSLRGVKFQMKRVGPRANARILLEVTGVVENKEELPKVPSVIDSLYTIWGVDKVPVVESNDIKKQAISDEMAARDGVRAYRDDEDDQMLIAS